MRERLMESDRLATVGELVAGVAHEVNNHLSRISAFAQLLLRDHKLAGTQREQVEVIRAETLRASHVVKDLLAFARRSEPRREPLDLNGVVARTLRLRALPARLQLRNGIEQALGSHTIPAVISDARQLQQVCLNLVVTNAVQAMAKPLGGRHADAHHTHAQGEKVILDVRDSAHGIRA